MTSQLTTASSPDLLKILRLLTPLRPDTKYGEWAKQEWSRALADLMGERERELGADCQPWDELELERQLHALSLELPTGTSMTQALDEVAGGLAAFYWTKFTSIGKTIPRTRRVHQEGLAANPKRDLFQGKRFVEALPEPWMRTVALQIVYAAMNAPTAGAAFNLSRFSDALESEGTRLPADVTMSKAIADVWDRLCEADPDWFGINIRGPLEQHLNTRATDILDRVDASDFDDAVPDSLSPWG